MKTIIFILFCYFFKSISCSDQPPRLTNEELIKIFGPRNDSAPISGIAKIRIPRGKVKRDAEDSWSFPIYFSDGSITILNLKRTDGILANCDTPVFYSKGFEDSDKIEYNRHKDLRKLGKFEFYQERKEHAAFVVFPDQNRIEGFVGEYQIQNSGNEQDDEYVFVLVPVSPRIYDSYMEHRVNHDTPRKNGTRDKIPKTVFPQLLIVLTQAQVQENLSKNLVRMLAYWNAADMLYDDIKKPQVKLNIAGFIAPLNDLATPWVTQNIALNDPHHKKLMKGMGQHFAKYLHIFPETEFDYMISFVKKLVGDTLGIAPLDIACDDRSHRIASIQASNLLTYDVGAHELGHLFSAEHDVNTTDCTESKGIMAERNMKYREWSECSKASFQEHFSQQRNKCLKNLPQTLNNFPYKCLRNPIKKCRSKGLVFTGNIKCDPKGLECRDPFDFGYLCSENPKDGAAMNICKFWNVLEPEVNPNITYLSGNGVICDRTESGEFSACVEGECIEIIGHNDQCPN